VIMTTMNITAALENMGREITTLYLIWR